MRFDVSLTSNQVEPSTPRGISIHALRHIQKDEEITLSYVDTTYPFEKRQEELKDRYFFTCACDVCARGLGFPRDRLGTSMNASQLTKIGDEVEKTLLKVQTEAGLEHTRIEILQQAITRLAETGCWPIHRYPSPQLRLHLLFGLLGSQRYAEALVHSGVLVRTIHPILFEQKHHPIRLVQLWTFCNICLYCLEASADQIDRGDDDNDLRMLGLLSFVVIRDLHNSLNEGVRVSGELERLIDEAFQGVKNEGGFWEYDQRDPAEARTTAWAWMDRQMTTFLEREASAMSQAHRQLPWLKGRARALSKPPVSTESVRRC